MNVIEFFGMYWDFWLFIGFFVSTAAAFNEDQPKEIFDIAVWVVFMFIWPIPLFMKYLDD